MIITFIERKVNLLDKAAIIQRDKETLVGRANGFKVMVGGSAGIQPRLADTIYIEVPAEQVIALVDNIIEAYKELAKGKERLSKTIDRISANVFKDYLEADSDKRRRIKAELLLS